MKTELITLLKQRCTYVSCQELCEKFGVSEADIRKEIEQLKKDGYVIETMENRGYLLKEDTARVFGYSEIESHIQTAWAGRTLYYYASIDSTNLRAGLLAEEGAPEGTLVVADEQSAGRGRRGRNWESPAGKNLYFTLLLRPKIAPDKASMLTLVMALSVAEAVKMLRHDDAACTVGIKWPNDILVNGRKICGILTEMSLSMKKDCIDHLIIGVGVNVRRQNFPDEFGSHAGALDEFFDPPVSRSELLAKILYAFENAYKAFLEEESLKRLKSSYEAVLANYGRNVRVLDPKGEYEGIARGIRDTGELIVELDDGTTKDVYAGEVSVRGIYGYV